MFNRLKRDTQEINKKLLLDAWKECVNVQMHFNDMEMKIRSLAVTVITAISGAIGYLLKENVFHQEEFLVLFSFVGIAAWLCFYLMDRFMYHKLLIGAVQAGIAAEEELKNIGVNVELGSEIKNASPLKNLFYSGLEMHSDQKLDFFYIAVPMICTNGILTYLRYDLIWVIMLIVVLAVGGIYTLSKGYNQNKDYNWFPFLIFIALNIYVFINVK